LDLDFLDWREEMAEEDEEEEMTFDSANISGHPKLREVGL
jgi:hypothetical protein